MINDSKRYLEFKQILYLKMEELTKSLQDPSVDFEDTQEIRYRIKQIRQVIDLSEGRIQHLH